MNAPIVIFAFNRLDALKNTVASLLKNEEAKESELFVFVDGPRQHKQGEVEKVNAVRKYVKSIDGFKNVSYTFSENNKGLGASIIAGVTEVINRYGRAIVLEDDLVLAKNFLAYMNAALSKYENEKQIFSVCGWGCLVSKPNDYPYDYYTCVRSSSWGWGTWKDRWNTVDWQLNDWNAVRSNRWKFNKWGGSDCYGMLKGWKTGKNKSWAIRFVYSQFVHDKLSLFPFKSMVDNYGFDGKGTDCPLYCRTKWKFVDQTNKSFIFPDNTTMDYRIYKDVMHYRTLFIRIKSKLINTYLKIINKLNKKINEKNNSNLVITEIRQLW